MKNAIGYFIAGAALLPELALAQKIIPTVLPTYWSYKGCYRFGTHFTSQTTLADVLIAITTGIYPEIAL